jgi:thioredoxin-dependent peroxiredoxin
VGDIAPDFTLEGDAGPPWALADARGSRVVLYFYPKDSTPGCTRQANEFSLALAEFARRNTIVIGVSKDSVKSHAGFRSRHKLQLPLLSDADLGVHKSYGVYGQKLMYGKVVMGTIRSTFIIDAAGVIEHVFSPVRVDGHLEAVLAALANASTLPARAKRQAAVTPKVVSAPPPTHRTGATSTKRSST